MSRLRFRAYVTGTADSTDGMYLPESVTFSGDGAMVWVRLPDGQPRGFVPSLCTIQVMQSIDRTDKNGKEMFEGDVVSFLVAIENFEYEHSGVVEWMAERSAFVIRERPGLFHDMNYEVSNLAVIGNVHEHPDLLN